MEQETSIPAALPVQARALFMRRLLRELTCAVEEVLGLDDARAYVSVVGLAMGDWIDRPSRAARRLEQLDAVWLARGFLELRARVEGNFHIVSLTRDRIKLINHLSPFAPPFAAGVPECVITARLAAPAPSGRPFAM